VSYLDFVFSFFVFLALAGLIELWRNSVTGRRPWLATIGIAGIIVLSLNPVAWLLSLPLEVSYEQDPIPKGTVEAIVVLAGAVSPPLPPQNPYAVVGRDSYIRLQRAAWLFHHWTARPVLACGGGENSDLYSQTMRHVLEAEGVPGEFIWIESRSRSTYENALYGSQVLRQHGVSRIALVTDARSMKRAAASFRKQGMIVVPAPFRFNSLRLSFEYVLPTSAAIEDNAETAHEMAGILWYWIRDRI